MKGSGKKDRDTKRALVDQFGGKCQRCGYHRCMRALQFHHADDSEKQEWSGKRGRASTKEIIAYPERFILLCANCHFEEHDRIDQEKKLYALCLNCGERFMTHAHRKRNKRGIYCSRECQFKHNHCRAKDSISERLWKHVDKVGECYVWTGYATRGTPVMAYPVGYKKNTIKPAARVLWELERGALEKTQQVWRACETTNCIRPEHQILGSRRAMMRPAGRAKIIAARCGRSATQSQGELFGNSPDDDPI